LLATERASIITDDLGPRSDDDIDVAGVVLANLTTHQLAKVSDMARHVREMVTGYQSGSPEICGPGEPRKEYAPDLPLVKRYVAKARELGIHERTVQRWLYAYREHGEAGLAVLSNTNRFISVITIRDRKVTQWRDYLDPLAVFDALGTAVPVREVD
jgi:ketosteroid isomerase-like protein